MGEIVVKGARQHNLKNVNLTIPKNKLIVFTGVSGSGKSSMAFDTIYAEGQRRYVESLSSYARQFLGVMDKPDVDTIEGLSPSISISQKNVSHNPRSTVGTITEIYDYLRLLFARVGHPHCPNCGKEVQMQDIDQITDSAKELINIATKKAGKRGSRFMILAPVVRGRRGEFTHMFESIKAKGFSYVRIDGIVYGIDDDLILIKTNKHNIEVVIDRFVVGKKDLDINRFKDGIEQALLLSNGLVHVSEITDSSFEMPERPKKFEDHLFSEHFACADCNINIAEIEPRLFSFNTPHGACKTCNGIGKILKVNSEMVLNDNLTISEGAITPLATHFMNDTWMARLIETVCLQNNIPFREPVSGLSNQQKNLLIEGTGKRLYRVKRENRYGQVTSIEETFPGITSILEKKHLESSWGYIREQIERFMHKEVCPECNGSRLKKDALSVTIEGVNIAEVTDLTIKESFDWIKSIKFSNKEQIISKPIVSEITNRLGFLNSVGLNYLTLGREAGTLAGGESQRIVLASQIGSGLTGVLYVLDEPSIGLHQRDNARLIKTLKHLRDLDNTVVVVEHDQETMESADWIVDFGPGGGKHGGEVVAEGTFDQIRRNKNSLTGKYLSGQLKVEHKTVKLDKAKTSYLTISGCSQFNLRNINVELPLGKLVCITGVSGSGKSTLVVETLYRALKTKLNPYYKNDPGKYTQITGYDKIKEVQLIDQSPIGRTPRSNPVTYTKAFDYIRDVFANTKMAKIKGYAKGRFSFNVKGGRCEACEGQGENKIEMQFMPDVYVKCEICKGNRYNSQTLDVLYKGKNIAQVLQMTVEEGVKFFQGYSQISRKLTTLEDVGLDYIELGQPAPLLSGGEAQRVKLASELSKHGLGSTAYILDEPTTGLHFHDLKKLLNVLHKLVAKGNTVIVIEHNLDIIKNADWIVDLGPEGGFEGGKVVATGTPHDIAKSKNSHTGKYLAKQ